MSLYGSQTRLNQLSRRSNSRPDLTAVGYSLPRTDLGQMSVSGNRFQAEYNDGYTQSFQNNFSRSSLGGGGGGGRQQSMSSVSVHKFQVIYSDCMRSLHQAQLVLENMGPASEVDKNMLMAAEALDQLKQCAIDLSKAGQPNDMVLRGLEECSSMHAGIRNSITGTTMIRTSNTSWEDPSIQSTITGTSLRRISNNTVREDPNTQTIYMGNTMRRISNNTGWEDPSIQSTITGNTMRRISNNTGWEDSSKGFQDAIAWINQNKRLIETAPFGEDSETISQQIMNHNRFHSSVQRSAEVDRVRDELMQSGDKSRLNALEREWDSLQKMSHARTAQLRDLQNIIEEISRAIMWVNDREEEELVFDWGDKNIDTYIPKKQESYSKLMSELEEKEKDLNKLKTKVDNLLKSQHPASDKIEAYMDTLQTQWSWLLQITKCIDVHLKENAAYSQFFKEANETYTKLQSDHDGIRKKYTCDKTTPLENLTEMLKNLEKEKERIFENKRQVQTLASKSKNIVCLKPRNSEEKSSSPIMVQALCDFKQDQKGIMKGNEAILKDNSQRSKWQVTGPGGLDMLIPSVCLIIPPPNPLSISLAKKNEQYFEAIMSIWNQLYINIKSLISWKYCMKDIQHINTLTLSMLSQMRPEEYRNIIKSLELHYQEFMRNSHGSEMFRDEDKRKMEQQYSGAQAYYDQMVIQLPTYRENGVKVDVVKNVDVVKEVKQVKVETDGKKVVGSSLNIGFLSDLSTLRRRLEAAESGLLQHLHVPLKENSVQECSRRLVLLQRVHQDLDTIQDEYLRLREKILRELEGSTNAEQTKFLRTELDYVNQKLGSLQGFSAAYTQRLTALQALMKSLLQAEDIIKVHEARLTEKETSSLNLDEVERHRMTLKDMKAELEQKKGVMKTLESELSKAVHWNGQIDQSFHQCDVDLSKYSELVGQMTDRWRRIVTQIDSRTWDLEKQEKQLNHYKQTSSMMNKWIQETRQRQDALQITKFSNMDNLVHHLNQQKALYSEIKGKKEKVDDVIRDSDTCSASIKDYELQLASYSAGLETLLNIPIKKTMLQSPATELRQEAMVLQSNYIELLTRSSDYYKFLGEMLKNMQELEMHTTKFDLLNDEMRRLKDNLLDQTHKNKSLEDTLTRYRLELTQSKEELISMEEVKRTQARQCNATKESLDSTQNQMKSLQDEVSRLSFLIEDEKRKKRLAEERYTNQQEEYELVMRKRQKELEELNMSKSEFERAIKDKEREIERLKLQLQDEASRRCAAESETSKTSMMIQRSDTHYKEIVQERDSLLSKLKLLEQDKGKQLRYEEELRRIKISLESELKQKQRLQDEIDKINKDFKYWKSQYESKEGQIRQGELDRDKAERDRASLQSEIQRLTAELRSVEERYKSRLHSSEREISELSRKREALEIELRRLQQCPVPCCKHTQIDVVSKTVCDGGSHKVTVQGLRGEVSLAELVDSNLLTQTDMDKINQGKLTGKDIEDRLKSYLGGSSCIAGIYDEANNRVLPFYQAMKEGLTRRGTTLVLLEAQAASGFIIDPVNNVCMTVEEGCRRALVGKEFKDKLLSAEKAVTGYKDPATGKIISLFQAIEKGVIERGHGIRLLESQIASGGIIDPKGSHRIDVEVAYKKGYFDREMNEILTYEGDDTKGFFDPNTHEHLTYLQLKKRCITDPKTGLILLPLKDKKKPQKTTSQKNTLRKRRVVIVDPDTGKEMTVREAYHRELIDYDTFLELSEQECEWEEITISASDGSKRLVVVDRKTGNQYDIQDSLDRGVIDKQSLDKYRAGTLTLTQFADMITSKSKSSELAICSSSPEDIATCSSPTQVAPSSPTIRKRFASVSITLSPPSDIFDDQSPVGAIFDTETLEKITIPEAQRRGIVDNITAQRLLEAQICTGGIINPATGQRLSLTDAVQQSIIDEDMAVKLKPAQKAYIGFEDVKTKKKLSAAEAIKEKWLPYDAGQRFLEFQYLTGGLIEPETGRRVTIEEAIRKGWLDGKGAQKLQDTRNYIKNITCPKTKLKISYKEAMDNCMVEENNGMKMLQATSMSTKGISSPYNVSSGPGSRTGSRAGSRTGSRSGSRRGSVDYTSSSTYSYIIS
ncbi:desmoplakin-like isoform X2 [Xyrauchen texanus]|uniref:desmoplakin-like isoform X2 n=1 Tax=Xyrauchen texanus TaxID=154827 RepID=UPI002241F4B9|nr:desmoplakin-like isoform X2 [Xyrauchen texanus]